MSVERDRDEVPARRALGASATAIAFEREQVGERTSARSVVTPVAIDHEATVLRPELELDGPIAVRPFEHEVTDPFIACRRIRIEIGVLEQISDARSVRARPSIAADRS